MEYKPYSRRVHYYETDQMGIVHHSNYIRWFEEARLDFMDQLGVSYPELEQQGVIIPVVDVQCAYRVSARYGDTVQIIPVLTKYTGVRMCFTYEVRFTDGTLCAEGSSSHCFVDTAHKPISIKRKVPKLHTLFTGLVEA